MIAAVDDGLEAPTPNLPDRLRRRAHPSAGPENTYSRAKVHADQKSRRRSQIKAFISLAQDHVFAHDPAATD
ncbi:hypothetical protein GCM10008023_39150 [Sphingomonas glacialis]|uniref:Transposase n=1 Tax=Sphingomonas glacialis TaxID=658225 RepID=A0ABQ3LUI9_9SPHN|nr:hypothetical protein GCM10008023_39150 [Sphingomonas glacialis]